MCERRHAGWLSTDVWNYRAVIVGGNNICLGGVERLPLFCSCEHLDMTLDGHVFMLQSQISCYNTTTHLIHSRRRNIEIPYSDEDCTIF